jgi:nitrite reductase/ring-hydroxylating ferredoxin subunit/uncharacterized membrane protein
VSTRARVAPAGPCGSPLHAAAVAIEHAGGLDAAGDRLTRAIRDVLPAGPPKDLLSGTWLGHALHPLLTDVPIGAWSSSFALDLLGGRRAQPAADLLIGLGLLAAMPAALTGAADWGDTQPRERRVGLVHAVANVAAVGVYSSSLASRRRGHRARGVALSALALGAVGAGAYLGGHLVLARGLGVDRTAFESRPEDWTDVADDQLIAEGTAVRVTVAGADIVLARCDGAIHALSDRCTHRGAPLHQGRVREGCIVCPWHQSIFRLSDGSIVQGPATSPAPRYDVITRGGRIMVRVPRADLV